MTAFTLSLGDFRRDEARWTGCFAVVLLVHATVALALLSKSEEPDFGVDAPVVMIELSESLLVSAAPPTDLAPGPKEDESEAAPAPEEDTKTPAPEAEVAIPEPPKPLPPQEQKQATAPPAMTARTAAVRRWETELVAHIERFKRYPASARARGDTGVARVAFTVDREGWLRERRLVQSSGSAELDQEALAMLTRAQPVPRPSEGIAIDELTFAIPVRFNIR